VYENYNKEYTPFQTYNLVSKTYSQLTDISQDDFIISDNESNMEDKESMPTPTY
jgi:hypothetical protein